MRSKPQEKPSSQMQSFWDVQPLNLYYLHINITAEKKNFAFSYAMVPLPATKFLQWCQKISVVFLHNPMVVNLMPKLHQLLLLFCPATLNQNGMLQASITVVRKKSCFHKLQPSYFLPLDCLIVTACSRGLTLGFRSTHPHTFHYWTPAENAPHAADWEPLFNSNSSKPYFSDAAFRFHEARKNTSLPPGACRLCHAARYGCEQTHKLGQHGC